MRDKSVIDSIDDYKSAVYLCIYRGGGWTRYKQTPQANSENLANKHSKKLGTLIYSTHTRTIRPTGADRPASGPDRPPAHFGSKHMPLPFGGAGRTKSNKLDVITSVFLGILPHTRMVLFEETPIQSLRQTLVLQCL